MEAYNELSACFYSPHRSQRLTYAALVVLVLSAFAHALPIGQNVQERSAALSKDMLDYSNSSSSIDNPCLTNKTAVEYGWEVYCPSHPQVCVSSTWRCNGIVDCEGLEDELNCTSSEERNFECLFGDVTIYLANDRRCNGQKDCPDGSDEDTECECPDGLEFCDSYCLPSSWWCDGEVDCEDGSDESDCTASLQGGEGNSTNGVDSEGEGFGDWYTFGEEEIGEGDENGEESQGGGEDESGGGEGEETAGAAEDTQGGQMEEGGGVEEGDPSVPPE